jgi:hypothetical protein
VYWLNQRQKQHEDRIQQAQKEHEEEATIQRAQNDALQAYLDQMSNLIVDREMRKNLMTLTCVGRLRHARWPYCWGWTRTARGAPLPCQTGGSTKIG